jgi:serine/threonine protein kinase
MNPAIYDWLRRDHGVVVHTDKPLGTGSFGYVYAGQFEGRLLDRKCAVKISKVTIDETSRDGETTRRERERLRAMVDAMFHPHIVFLYELMVVGGHLVTCWELCDTDLSVRLKESRDRGEPGIPYPELLRYMKEAARAVDHLNARHLIHRDIKPSNVLLQMGSVKLGDFGLTREVERSSVEHTRVGTYGYCPPESVQGLYSPDTDKFGLVAMYVELRTGKNPFGANKAERANRVRSDERLLTGLQPDEADWVRRSLNRERSQRPKGTALEWFDHLERLVDPHAADPPAAPSAAGAIGPNTPGATLPHAAAVRNQNRAAAGAPLRSTTGPAQPQGAFPCDPCNRPFRTPQQLAQHNKDKHVDEPLRCCKSCGAGFVTPDEARAHYRDLHHWRICSCGQPFPTEEAHKQHLETSHA